MAEQAAGGKPKAARQQPDVRPKRTASPEVVRRRIPGYKLVNGGWRRDPSTARKDS